jgi:hypothetical protein
MADADDDAALQAAIAASLADVAGGPGGARPDAAASGYAGDLVELSSDDDDGGGRGTDAAAAAPSSSGRPPSGSAGSKRGRGAGAPPPTEAELDAVFSFLASRATVDASSLTAASTTLLGAPPDPDTLQGMLLLAHEAAGGARLGRLTRAEFRRLARRVLGGG